MTSLNGYSTHVDLNDGGFGEKEGGFGAGLKTFDAFRELVLAL